MQVLKRVVRSFTNRSRRLINPLLLSLTARGLRVEDAVIIAGSNRSGTTWLQEVLAELPGAVTVFEPLHVDVVGPARRAGFHKLSAFDRQAERPTCKAYLERVLSGREWHWYTAQFNTPQACLRPRQLVVKFIHANGVLDWMTHQLPVRRPLVVIRHPAAVNSSVLNQQWDISRLKEDLLLSELVQSSRDLRRFIETLSTPVEQLTARWCLENAILFKAPKPWRFDLASYESLVMGGPAALIQLFQNWNLTPPASVSEAYARDSAMSAINRNYSGVQQRLSKWRQELSSDQIQTILRITREFGLDFYSEEVAPDESRLSRCNADGLLSETCLAHRAA